MTSERTTSERMALVRRRLISAVRTSDAVRPPEDRSHELARVAALTAYRPTIPALRASAALRRTCTRDALAATQQSVCTRIQTAAVLRRSPPSIARTIAVQARVRRPKRPPGRCLSGQYGVTPRLLGSAVGRV